MVPVHAAAVGCGGGGHRSKGEKAGSTDRGGVMTTTTTTTMMMMMKNNGNSLSNSNSSSTSSSTSSGFNNVCKPGSEGGGSNNSSSSNSFHRHTGAFAHPAGAGAGYAAASPHSPWGVHHPAMDTPPPAGAYPAMEPIGDVASVVPSVVPPQWCSPGGYMLQPQHSPAGVPPPYGSITPTSPPNGHYHHHHHHHPPPAAAYQGCYLAPYPGLPAPQVCNPGGMEPGMGMRGKQAGEGGGKSRRGCLRDEFDKPASLVKAVEASKKLGQPGPARWFNSQGFPLRTGKPDCKHYISKAWCLYGTMCKFNHPEPGLPAGPPMAATYHPSHMPPPPAGHSPQGLIPSGHWGGAPAPYFWTPWGGMMARGYVMGAPYYHGVVYRTGSVDSAVSSLSNINGGDSDRASDEGGVIDSAASCGH